jgi:hypothetical protein
LQDSAPQHCDNTLFSMGADYEDRLRFFEARWWLGHEIDHRLVADVPENRQWTPQWLKSTILAPSSELFCFTGVTSPEKHASPLSQAGPR